MIAVTTQSQAWVETAAIAAVAVPCYLIWLIHFVRTQARIPSERTRQSSAGHSSPRAVGPISRRGTAGCETAAACPAVAAINDLGAEFDEVKFQWRRGA